MPFRTITHTSLCMVCSAHTTSPCRNCGGAHCAAHMMGPSCAACQSELWALERAKVGPLTLTTASVGVLGLAALLVVSPTFTLGWLAFSAYLVAAPLVNKGATWLIRRKLAARRLMARSKPMRFSAVATPSENTTRDSEYNLRRRRRNNKSIGQRAPRAVFMTRGGYFYQ